MKRLLSLTLVLVFAVSLIGCGGSGVSDSSSVSSNNSVADSSQNDVSSAGSETQASSTVPSENVFPLTAEKLKDYCIVLPKYNVSNLVVRKVDELVKYIETKLDVKLSVVRDSAEAKKYEIVVDNCNRQGVKKISDYTTYDIYNDGVKLFINGGRNYSVVYALQLIIDDISGDYDIDAAASSGQYANEDTYRLVWTDEFDSGESYNKEFWNDADYAEPSLGNYYGMIPYRSDSLKNLYVKDGAIHHAASYDDEYFYGTFMTTKNKVMFTYGFAEISAKLADGEGLWHCFWLWDSGVTTGGNLLEFDVMECWSGAQYYLNVVHETVGGILQDKNTGTENNKTHSYVTIDHAWKNNSGLEFWRDEKKDTRPERLMSEQFHTFSVLWDEERVAFYRDGTCTLDFNYAEESENLELYRNPHYIILSYAVGSNKFGNPDDVDNDSKQMAGVKRPVLDADYWYNGKNIFSVDYVQVFQKDGWYHKIG